MFWIDAAYGGNEGQYPCADYKPGEDDLESFDYIRKFELDVNLDGYPGVSRVRGSNRMQTAYRIDGNADLVMPTRWVWSRTWSRIQWEIAWDDVALL